jgi:hypothetical protein
MQTASLAEAGNKRKKRMVRKSAVSTALEPSFRVVGFLLDAGSQLVVLALCWALQIREDG